MLQSQCLASALTADEAGLLNVFRDSLALNFGDHGVARSAMSLSGEAEIFGCLLVCVSNKTRQRNVMCGAVKYYNPVTSLCMVRCGTEEYRQVSNKAMLFCCIYIVNGQHAVIFSLNKLLLTEASMCVQHQGMDCAGVVCIEHDQRHQQQEGHAALSAFGR